MGMTYRSRVCSGGTVAAAPPADGAGRGDRQPAGAHRHPDSPRLRVREQHSQTVVCASSTPSRSTAALARRGADWGSDALSPRWTTVADASGNPALLMTHTPAAA